MKKLLITITVVLVAALAYAIHTYSPILRAGSGFSAKNICSGHFLSGLPGQQVVDEALVPASSVLANTSFVIDEAKQQVDTNLFGLFERRAVYSAGTGCTLLPTGQTHIANTVKVVSKPNPTRQIPWPDGTAAVALDPQLVKVIKHAFDEPDPQIPRNTKAVVVIHNGQLVGEHYAAGIDADTPLIGWSMTKSVTNLLIGMLIKDGKLTLHQPAPVPQWQQQEDDPRAKITIDQLLRMSSGLVFEEVYGLQSDVTQMLSLEENAAAYAASKPLLAAPGSLWAYSSGTSNILSGIIKLTLGGGLQTYYDFAQQRLFLPLGITSASIETDFSGNFIGSSYMYATARDWARLGQFSLQQGQWHNQALLPADWITYSATPTPSHPRNNYGAHFWLNADPQDPQTNRTWPTLPADTFSMNGYQGQRVVIIPSENLVVVRLGFSGGRNRGVEQLVAGILEVLASD